jgi:hypothetical protein
VRCGGRCGDEAAVEAAARACGGGGSSIFEPGRRALEDSPR